MEKDGKRGKRQLVVSKGRGTLGVRKGGKVSESKISRISQIARIIVG